MKSIGIHGIGQTFEGSETLRAEWLPALNSGLKESGASLLKDEEFSVVSYGSLFRPSGKRAAGVPQLGARDVEAGWEEALLTAWWRAAAELSKKSKGGMRADSPEEHSGIQGPDFEGRAQTPAAVQRALRQLAKSKFFRGVGPERVLIFGLKQVRRFLHDKQLKQAVLTRVANEISSHTRIVIGHSLGSIVAYEALCAHSEWKVHTLVTLGSPLGIPNLIFDELTPKPKDGRGAWPNVKKWINIADSGDIVALEKKLAPRFGPVIDKLIYNGWKSHDAKRYLTTVDVGEAVAQAL